MKQNYDYKLNNISMYNLWTKEELKRAIRKYFELNDKESAKYQNLCNIVKT